MFSLADGIFPGASFGTLIPLYACIPLYLLLSLAFSKSIQTTHLKLHFAKFTSRTSLFQWISSQYGFQNPITLV